MHQPIWDEITKGELYLNFTLSFAPSSQQEKDLFTSFVHDCTGLGFITFHRLRESMVKKLCSPACSRLENAIFSPHIHATDGK